MAQHYPYGLPERACQMRGCGIYRNDEIHRINGGGRIREVGKVGTKVHRGFWNVVTGKADLQA